MKRFAASRIEDCDARSHSSTSSFASGTLARMSRIACSPRPAFRTSRTTGTPLANPIEVAAPIPDAAPVTSATRPSTVAIFLIIPALGGRVGEKLLSRQRWRGGAAQQLDDEA